MFNELKHITEELYSFAQYLQIEEEDIPKILGVKGETLNAILNDDKQPSQATAKAIFVLHDILEKDMENTVLDNFLELYGEEENK